MVFGTSDMHYAFGRIKKPRKPHVLSDSTVPGYHSPHIGWVSRSSQGFFETRGWTRTTHETKFQSQTQ